MGSLLPQIVVIFVLVLSGMFPPAYASLFCIAALMLFATYKLVFYPRFLSPLRTVPGPPLGNIIVGQYSAILEGEAGIPQRQWVKEYGPVVRVVGPIGIERLIFTKPSALHQILVSDWVNFPRPSCVAQALGLTAGFGLLAVPNDEHQQMRRAMNPAFSTSSLISHADTFSKCINGLLDILEREIDSCDCPQAGQVFQMYEWVGKLTLDIICATGFGYITDSLHHPHNELAASYENLVNLQSGYNISRLFAAVSIPGASRLLASDWMYRHRYLFKRIPGGNDFDTLVESMYRIREVATHILAERTRDAALLDSDFDAKCDVVSLLVQARRNDISQAPNVYTMSDYDMVQHVLTFLGAGHESTASGIAWTLWLLANDMPSQTELRDEVSPLLSQSDACPDYKRLYELSWLDCVIMEALRVLPPVPMTFRIADRDTVVDGVFVPKGTLLYIPIRVVNTWKEIWGEDAEEFKPRRWLNLPPKCKSTTSFLSFYAGPNACIGKTMALMEMKAVVASLIAKFEFTPAIDGQQIRPTAALTMKPSDGLPLRVRKVERGF